MGRWVGLACALVLTLTQTLFLPAHGWLRPPSQGRASEYVRARGIASAMVRDVGRYSGNSWERGKGRRRLKRKEVNLCKLHDDESGVSMKRGCMLMCTPLLDASKYFSDDECRLKKLNPTDSNAVVDWKGKIHRLGYKRRVYLPEKLLALTLGMLAIFSLRRWGMVRAIQRYWTARRYSSLVISSFLAIVLSRRIQTILLWIYKEAFLSPARSWAKDVLPLPQSEICDAAGLRVHVLREKWSSQYLSSDTIIHMNHGFGANSLSWSRVLKPLAQGVKGTALAHDCPGFGLTERPGLWSALKGGYAVQRNADITVELVKPPIGSLRSTVLCGHQMGAISAVLAALDPALDPKRTTLILVAPSLSSLLAASPPKEFRFGAVPRRVSSTVKSIVRPVTSVVNFCYQGLSKAITVCFFLPGLVIGLRSIVYQDGSIWKKRLQPCFYDNCRVDDDLIKRCGLFF